MAACVAVVDCLVLPISSSLSPVPEMDAEDGGRCDSMPKRVVFVYLSQERWYPKEGSSISPYIPTSPATTTLWRSVVVSAPTLFLERARRYKVEETRCRASKPPCLTIPPILLLYTRTPHLSSRWSPEFKNVSLAPLSVKGKLF